MAEKINKKNIPYKIKLDYNENFFIDNQRKSPVSPSKNCPKPNDYLKDIFLSKNFICNINKLYNNSIYNWAKNNYENSNYNPLRHLNSLLAINIILGDLSKKKKY